MGPQLILRYIWDNIKDNLAVVREESRVIILGLTGGVASGKSTVARMLEEMGVHIIDFDILARQIVEHGKPAWKEIVDYFGNNILQDDGNIDRKKLSAVVFQDADERRRLEAFTHPHIAQEFVRRVNEIAIKDPEAIIQAVVPLLIECNMEDLFHVVVVVYVPQGKQIERLMKRDGISRDRAIDIIKAQMSMDEKIGYADFIIHNEDSLENTKRQVDEFWRILMKYKRR